MLKKISLAGGAAQVAQEVALLDSLDAFGYQPDLEVLGQRADPIIPNALRTPSSTASPLPSGCM